MSIGVTEGCQKILDVIAELEADGLCVEFTVDYDGHVESIDVVRPGDPEWASLDRDSRTVKIRKPVAPRRLMFSLPDVPPDPRLGPLG